MLSIEVLDKVGAIKTPYIIELELGDGRKVEAEVYVVAIKINDREGPAIIATFEDVKRVLGIQTLEPTRSKGVAYFY